MKSIALIHTIESVVAGFDDSLRSYLEYEAEIHNLWGGFLASNPDKVGEFAIQGRNRLLCDMKAQELIGADIIITTCSTLTPTMELVRPFIQVSVIAIGDAAARRNVLYGKRIMAMATAENTVGPTVSEIKTEAGKAGREAGISICVYMGAFHAMKAMDTKKRDMILREKARELKDYGCIVLAQTSVARLGGETASIAGCPALTNLRLYMEGIKNKLEEVQR